MSKPIVYIDGKEGTTGLQIFERLGSRTDIELLLIDDDKRKDTAARKKLLNAADIVFLCLPDQAAIEAVSLIENEKTRVIDASTAHRTAEGWTYGFAELSGAQREQIAISSRVANPGCHATGFISIVYPLVQMGILPQTYPLTCFSLTGYSGGGKKMIAEYEGAGKTDELFSPRIYGLSQAHKHLPEMCVVTGLKIAPVFCPIVDDYYKGMATSVALHRALLPGKHTATEIQEKLKAYYATERLVSVAPLSDSGMLPGNGKAGKDDLELFVSGNDERILITAVFDNLGKGASGAAVQNMNIMLGLDEATGLNV